MPSAAPAPTPVKELFPKGQTYLEWRVDAEKFLKQATHCEQVIFASNITEARGLIAKARQSIQGDYLFELDISPANFTFSVKAFLLVTPAEAAAVQELNLKSKPDEYQRGFQGITILGAENAFAARAGAPIPHHL